MYIKNEYYSILNSKRTDTLSVIKNNYKNLVKIHHPDVGGDEEYFKRINLAMDIINEFHNDSDKKEYYNNNKTNNDNYKAKQKTKNTNRRFYSCTIIW